LEKRTFAEHGNHSIRLIHAVFFALTKIARKLLLTIDPLAALALTQEQIQERLREITPVDEAELQELWARETQKLLAAERGRSGRRLRSNS
jgi:hypothetical protein